MPKTYRLAPTFWWDHVSRDLATDDCVKTAGRYCVYVDLDPEQYSELLSDAEHYAADDGGFDPMYRDLMKSAQRVVEVLRKEGPPE